MRLLTYYEVRLRYASKDSLENITLLDWNYSQGIRLNNTYVSSPV